MVVNSETPLYLFLVSIVNTFHSGRKITQLRDDNNYNQVYSMRVIEYKIYFLKQTQHSPAKEIISDDIICGRTAAHIMFR